MGLEFKPQAPEANFSLWYLKKGDKGILNLFIIETRTAVTKHKNQIEEGFFKY